MVIQPSDYHLIDLITLVQLVYYPYNTEIVDSLGQPGPMGLNK